MKLIDFDTPYTDTISRQAAIDAMREETCMSCWDAKDILAHLPSVSTEKTGRWELVYIDCGIEYYLCSKCHEGKVAIDGDYYKNITEFIYCPSCGAKMEEEE